MGKKFPSPSRSCEPDVFVAGGGPAGLACAIAAAQRGLTVEVADGMIPPIDKACGEGLMPDSLEALARLGVDIPANESFHFKGIRFLASDRTNASGQSKRPQTQAAFPHGHGVGVRRILLHQLLIDRAATLGVRFSWQTVVQGIEPGHSGQLPIVCTNRHSVQPRFIIGADGHQSRVRSWARLDRATTTARRVGLRQHFALAPWSDHVEVYWSDHGQAYVTPVSEREVCVAFVASRRFETVPQALRYFPELQQHLASASPVDRARGSITLSRKLHRVTIGNIALIGDASGSIDAVTGEGLGLCFRQALVLAEALQGEDLGSYQQAHRSLIRLPHFMARTMLLLDRSPALRSSALRILQHSPWIFERLLQIHLGETFLSFPPLIHRSPVPTRSAS